MVRRGADPKAADPDGITPLHLAVRGGHAPVVGLLLEAGVPRNPVAPGTPAATRRRGPDDEVLSAFTPLHLAVFSGHGGLVAQLLDAGAKTEPTCRLQDWDERDNSWDDWTGQSGARRRGRCGT